MLSDLLDTILSSEIFTDLISPSLEIDQGDNVLERAAKEVAGAVKRSFNGSRLIAYEDLPQAWRNNPFVAGGYRFIPLEKWPLLIWSLFDFHNETLNIHTHLVPFIFWGWSTLTLANSDHVEVLFTAFALICLFSSALWHTMAGCAHEGGMEFCARVDYVGIGWLISASVATVVHYGFQCNPELGNIFLLCCFLTGLAGNICPFMSWFNQVEYRLYRIAFFLALAFSSLAPLATLSVLHSTREVLDFMGPVIPSLVSYLVGLTFYATHFPERFIPAKWSHYLDFFGAGSHAIWHLFIVLAISQHKASIAPMRPGIACTLT